MNQLKKLLCSRIDSLQTIQQQSINGCLSYEQIIEHKKKEKYRGIKQVEILNQLNAITFSQAQTIKEVYLLCANVCYHFDENFQTYLQPGFPSLVDSLHHLLSDFFSQHGFNHKTKLIQDVCERGLGFVSPSMILSWLVEWSKKIFCDVLQEQIKNCFANKKNEKKWINSLTTNITNAQRRKQSLFSNNLLFENKYSQSDNQLFLVNKVNVYSCFQDQLQFYYKFILLDGVDLSYLKTFRRQGKKEDLLRVGNIKKAMEILIQNSANREVKRTIQEYEKAYYQRFPIEVNEKRSQAKKKYLVPVRRPTLITENGEFSTSNKSQLLAPKISEADLIRSENIVAKVKKFKSSNKKIAAKSTNLEFPIFKGLSLSKQTQENKIIFLSKLSLKSREVTSLEHHSPTKLKQQEKKSSIKDRAMKPNKKEKKIEKIDVQSSHTNEYDDKKMYLAKKFTLAQLKNSPFQLDNYKCSIERNFSS